MNCLASWNQYLFEISFSKGLLRATRRKILCEMMMMMMTMMTVLTTMMMMITIIIRS